MLIKVTNLEADDKILNVGECLGTLCQPLMRGISFVLPHRRSLQSYCVRNLDSLHTVQYGDCHRWVSDLCNGSFRVYTCKRHFPSSYVQLTVGLLKQQYSEIVDTRI